MLNVTLHTIWRLRDSHRVCVINEAIGQGEVLPLPCFSGSLPEYLNLYGFNIDTAITYCLAENSKFSLKYRKFGGSINIYININKSKLK